MPDPIPNSPSFARGGVPVTDDMRARVSAYPGNLTYVDLIRKNKRDSAILMIIMVVFAVAIGGTMASAIAVYAGIAPSLDDLLPSIILGCLAAFIVASLATLWSWFGGASAILAMSGAQEIQKADDPQLFNVVEELAIAAGLPMPRVYIINDSAMNAFATGRDAAHAAVAITRGLL